MVGPNTPSYIIAGRAVPGQNGTILDERLDRWLAALEARHLADLTLAEVARALRSLSSTYVERRHRLGGGAALSGGGKRAAFALFYGALHYFVVREIVRALPGATASASLLVDLGCGTGAAGAAWALSCRSTPAVLGIDRHPWALAEAARTYRDLGVTARLRRTEITSSSLPRRPALILAAFTLNELAPDTRNALLAGAIDRVRARPSQQEQRGRLLVIEPIAQFVAPWWDEWRRAVVAAGGRADEWRFRMDLPPIVTKLDRAAGLNHRELTARSFWLA